MGDDTGPMMPPPSPATLRAYLDALTEYINLGTLNVTLPGGRRRPVPGQNPVDARVNLIAATMRLEAAHQTLRHDPAWGLETGLATLETGIQLAWDVFARAAVRGGFTASVQRPGDQTYADRIRRLGIDPPGVPRLAYTALDENQEYLLTVGELESLVKARRLIVAYLDATLGEMEDRRPAATGDRRGWIRTTKGAISKFYGMAEAYTAFADNLAKEGRLEIRQASKRRIEVRFADPDEHERFRRQFGPRG